MQKSLLSLVAIGFLLASCGGGSSTPSDTSTNQTGDSSTGDSNNGTTADGSTGDGSSSDGSTTTDSSGSDSSDTSTGDGSQENIDNSINNATYSIPTVSEVDKARFVDAINEARAVSRDCKDGNGVLPAADPLIWNDNLYAAAYEHNYDMIKANYFDHYGSGTEYDITGTKLGKKSDPLDRIKANGYMDSAGSYGVGENLAAGQSTIADAVSLSAQNWLDSPLHCANLMNADFTEMGLSKVKNPTDGTYYWTHTLGYRR